MLASGASTPEHRSATMPERMLSARTQKIPFCGLTSRHSLENPPRTADTGAPMKTLDPLSPRARVALLGEILTEYAPCWRILRTKNVVDMVRAARDVPATRPRGPDFQEHKMALRLGRAVVKTL